MIYSNDKPLLSLFFFSWVLMSDYFTSHSALDKWPRQAVKNRSKPLGWEQGGRSREAVKSFPSAARQASENATHYSCAVANQSFRVIREEETQQQQQQHLNKSLWLQLKYGALHRRFTVSQARAQTVLLLLKYIIKQFSQRAEDHEDSQWAALDERQTVRSHFTVWKHYNTITFYTFQLIIYLIN